MKVSLISTVLRASLLAIVLTSCSMRPRHPIKQTLGPSYVTVCYMLSHKAHFVGKQVRVRGIYKTDHMTYAFFKDRHNSAKSCPLGDIIQGGYELKEQSASAKQFFSIGNKRCNDANVSSCVQKAYVDFIGIVKNGDEGIYLQLLRVTHFKYY